MSSRSLTSQASSNRASPGAGGFGGFDPAISTSKLSYITPPPSLTGISDSNVVVCFKNLSKKDPTTKGKALEDLRQYVEKHPYELDGGVEDAILEAWVQLYPRLAIDNSRRVRELSHLLQVDLLKSGRKRMQKLLPMVVGSWLGGLSDRDRAVAKVTSEGVHGFLDTTDRYTMFWTKCQELILEYATQALKETPKTLSDERTMSADDMQAKYFRVIGSSISLVTGLLGTISETDVTKKQDVYDEYFSNKRLWSFASCEDAFVRKAVDELIILCLKKQKHVLEANLDSISHALLSEALRSSQVSSTQQLLSALVSVSSEYPAMWTISHKSRRNHINRFQSFIEKGSQGGTTAYWMLVGKLIPMIPRDILPEDLTALSSLLSSFRKGIGCREEPRSHGAAAWSAYLRTVQCLSDDLPDTTSRLELAQHNIYPMFRQFLYPDPGNSSWTVGNGSSIDILAKAYAICAQLEGNESSDLLQAEWNHRAAGLIDRVDSSLPEQSKNFAKSQDEVASEAQRWFELAAEVLSENYDPNEILVSPSRNIIAKCFAALVTRNGKPYCAAAAVEAALRLAPFMVTASATMVDRLRSFLEDHFSNLIFSPSQRYLVLILHHFSSLLSHKCEGAISEGASVWSSTITGLIAMPPDSARVKAITALIGKEFSSLADGHDQLQYYVRRMTSEIISGTDEAWTLFETAITFHSLSQQSETFIMTQATACLNTTPHAGGAMKVLELMAKKRPSIVAARGDKQVNLLSCLLSLAEVSDENLRSRASSLRATIESYDGSSGEGDWSDYMAAVIKQNLESANSQSLSIDLLANEAYSISTRATPPPSKSKIVPDVGQWTNALSPLLEQKPNIALGVMRPLTGSVFLVDEYTQEPPLALSRDKGGHSIALRFAMYTAKMLSVSSFVDQVSRSSLVEFLYLLGVTYEMLNDQLDLLETGRLFGSFPEPDGIDKFQTDYLRVLNHFTEDASTWHWSPGLNGDGGCSDTSSLIYSLIDRLLGVSKASQPVNHYASPAAYYASKCLSRLLLRITTHQALSCSDCELWLTQSDVVKTPTNNVLGASAILIALEDSLRDSKLVGNLCNRLISDLAVANQHSERTLGLLVLLNACLGVYEDGKLPIVSTRIVFAIKQINKWTDSWTERPRELDDQLPLASEALRTLQKLLPATKEVYGDQWTQSLIFCCSLWQSDNPTLSDERIPAIGMSLQLFEVLRNTAANPDACEDVGNALTELEGRLSEGLFKLLNMQRLLNHQPLRFVDDMLSRLVANVPWTLVQDPSDFFPLIASDFRMVQSAAFDVLHRVVPELQQQISIDVLLYSKDAQLPEELLSLLLNKPDLDAEDDKQCSRSSLRGFLLSWHLVYDSYGTASVKVRDDYSRVLKSENYIASLLDVMTTILGHKAADSLNLKIGKFDDQMIRDYDMWKAEETETDERGTVWLLVHLYYLSLKYTPSLVKSWWLDCSSRQTKIALESWTKKHFSPLVIADTLDEVEKWAKTQETSIDDGNEIMITISPKSREIFAGYEIDDLTLQVVIRLPESFPFEGVIVDGINRVACTEKQWNGWLMNTRGAITFSDGSIISGLIVLRKNIVGAMEGHTECAICYSIISSDKKTPDKKCQTCNNLFHGDCLFKWFKSSSQNTCPLCRNPFNFGNAAPRGMRA